MLWVATGGPRGAHRYVQWVYTHGVAMTLCMYVCIAIKYFLLKMTWFLSDSEYT